MLVLIVGLYWNVVLIRWIDVFADDVCIVYFVSTLGALYSYEDVGKSTNSDIFGLLEFDTWSPFDWQHVDITAIAMIERKNTC